MTISDALEGLSINYQSALAKYIVEEATDITETESEHWRQFQQLIEDGLDKILHRSLLTIFIIICLIKRSKIVGIIR